MNHTVGFRVEYPSARQDRPLTNRFVTRTKAVWPYGHTLHFGVINFFWKNIGRRQIFLIIFYVLLIFFTNKTTCCKHVSLYRVEVVRWDFTTIPLMSNINSSKIYAAIIVFLKFNTKSLCGVSVKK